MKRLRKYSETRVEFRVTQNGLWMGGGGLDCSGKWVVGRTQTSETTDY